MSQKSEVALSNTSDLFYAQSHGQQQAAANLVKEDRSSSNAVCLCREYRSLSWLGLLPVGAFNFDFYASDAVLLVAAIPPSCFQGLQPCLAISLQVQLAVASDGGLYLPCDFLLMPGCIS
eukprot:6214323-Pleurochrysis_carterae.AAC.3